MVKINSHHQDICWLLLSLHSICHDYNLADLFQLDFTIPTLFLSECVLMYITSDGTHKLLSYLSSNFSAAHYINYDVVCIYD